MIETTREPVLVDLALQGGGSHGAFTWGVLDRLLEEPWLRIEAISGTSAGAMNAALLADGWVQGGAEGARATLDTYWRRVSQAAVFSPVQRSPLDRLMGRWTLDTSPAYVMMDLMARVLSPYDLNPLGLNPLRRILTETIDFGRLTSAPIRLFITATNVRTGRGRIFRNKEITPDVLLASACLPTMFQAIEIDGEAYWDGGYMGNPAIFPLIYGCESADIVIVHINPLFRAEVPHSADDILNRINEISFNSSLMREMRAVSFVTKLVTQKRIDGGLKHVLIHSISDDAFMGALTPTSKFNADWDFLIFLRDQGRKCADKWLADNFAKLGVESSVDAELVYL